MGFVGEGVDQALVPGDFEVADVFDGELGHARMLAEGDGEYTV